MLSIQYIINDLAL